MFNFFKNLFKKKKKDEYVITVTVNGEDVSDIDNEKLSELFKKLSNQLKPGTQESEE